MKKAENSVALHTHTHTHTLNLLENGGVENDTSVC